MARLLVVVKLEDTLLDEGDDSYVEMLANEILKLVQKMVGALRAQAKATNLRPSEQLKQLWAPMDEPVMVEHGKNVTVAIDNEISSWTGKPK